MYTDAHLHLFDLAEQYKGDTNGLYHLTEYLRGIVVCSSSHCLSEHEWVETFCTANDIKAFYSFGIHPQLPEPAELSSLEKLLREKRIQAIGEMGFDLFDEKNKCTFSAQEKMWHAQLELAKQYKVPIVLHVRKANQLVFKNSAELKKVPAVIFHGWAGSPVEAHSLLRAHINAFFSLGKSLLRGQKTALAMARSFPLDRLLTETDAPYMCSKGEAFSTVQQIETVAATLAGLRTVPEHSVPADETVCQIQKNFLIAFGACFE